MSSIEQHLSPEEIELLHGAGTQGGSPPKLGSVKRAFDHAARCERCRSLLDAHGRVDQELNRLKADADQRSHIGPSCPPDADWWEFAAGAVSESRASALLQQTIECGGCAELLRQAMADLTGDTSDEEAQEVDQLESARESVQKALALRLAASAGATIDSQSNSVESKTTSTASSWRRSQALWTAAAAVLAALLGGTLWFYYQEPSVERLLAQAYTERRTVELRIPGASFAPLRQERTSSGSSLSKPSSLLRSEYLIKDRLERHTDDSFWLGAKGRAEILEWNYEEAIRSLRRALDSDPGSPDLLRDLGTAYFQRAEVEERPTDFGQAVEYLGQALAKTPDDPVSLFNRAIANERIFAFQQAITDWESYLRFDPDGDWAAEAKERLARVRRRIDQSFVPPPEGDPARALPLLVRRLDGSSEGEAWGDASDEDYVEVALTRWLPSLGVDSSQSPERRSLDVLASVLEERHGDHWLGDVLSRVSKGNARDGLLSLADAIRLRGEGEFDEAARRAKRAADLFSREDCLACAMRARWELAYALQRGQDGRACLDEARLGLNATPDQYPWLRTQFLLEKTACSLMVGKLDQARDSASEALQIGRSAAYGTLLLRTLYFAGVAMGRDDPSRAWAYFLEGLKRHFGSSYRPFLLYQFYAEMAYAAETDAKWHLALTLADEAVTHMSQTPNRLAEAMARHRVGVDARLAGNARRAAEEFVHAGRLFDSLPRSALVDTFQFSAEVYRASLESQSGRPDRALERLRMALPKTRDVTQYWIWLHFYQTLGEAHLRENGSLEEAERALRAALSISEMALGTLSDDRDRALWDRQAGRAYRALVELELEKRHDAYKALEIMEWYRAAPWRQARRLDDLVEIDFSSLGSKPFLPSMDLVRRFLPQLNEVTVVSFVRTSSAVHAWMFDDRGVRTAKIDAPPESVDALTGRFYRHCSDAASDLGELRRVGGELYRLLLAPFESHLDDRRTLVVEVDGTLGQIPFAALVSSTGEYLGERSQVAYSPGLVSWSRHSPSSGIDGKERALVMGVSSGAEAFGIPLLPLPHVEQEALSVAEKFEDHVALVGPRATLSAIERELPRSVVFHFAGHALASEGRSGLLLRDDSPSNNGSGNRGFFDSTGISRLDLKHMRLVVLAACATSTTEGGFSDPRNLTRAFLRAGVPHVVASRWDVDSGTTRDLMETFYDRLHELSAVEALKLASEAIRAHPMSVHPYYWAAFSVYGQS